MHRRLTAVVLAASLAVAGCAVEQPVSPLPTEAAATTAAAPPAGTSPSESPSTSASPPAASPSSRRPVTSPSPSRTPTTRPPTSPSSSSCQGAVVYTIDLTTDELALVPALCLGVGAVLRIKNIGPGEVTTDSPDLVDPNYEAGIQDIRFVRAGTVVVTIPQGGTSYDVTVVVR